MDKAFKIPPISPKELTKLEGLKRIFSPLIGSNFFITKKSRTDGSNLRKLIASELSKYKLPQASLDDQYEFVPPKKKGIPKITREFIDTYIVTSGKSYNLQVWNRLPASESLLIKYESGESLKCTDVRFVLVKIDVSSQRISSIIIATPNYIVQKFGEFGKPTIKHQLLISSKIRKKIIDSTDKIMFYKDTPKLTYLIKHDFESPNRKMSEAPQFNEIFSIGILKTMVAEKLIGFKLDSGSTKIRGQALERKVLELLGYDLLESSLLYGAFPDIPHQFLEVKVQDTQTVDLGKFSPEYEEVIDQNLNLTTFDVRYLIALTDPVTETIDGIILSPGSRLGEFFSYVSDKSYKCQRSIPMEFFDKYKGQIAINPD